MNNKQKVVNRLLGVKPCGFCDDEGLFIVDNKGHTEVQKCDACKRFSSDIEAWKYVKPEGRR